MADFRTGWQDWANFRFLGDCFLWAVFLEITEGAHTFGLLFSTEKVMSSYLETTGWATLWAIFSQTHLVALFPNSCASSSCRRLCFLSKTFLGREEFYHQIVFFSHVCSNLPNSSVQMKSRNTGILHRTKLIVKNGRHTYQIMYLQLPF
jgi:hypothetical protein